MNEDKQTLVTKYVLESDTTVEVHKVFGSEYYVAFVTMDGRYPASEGKVAHDVNREEYMHIESGSVTLWHNGAESTLSEGDNVLIQDGDSYSLSGKARAVVFVKDGEGGTSEIVDKK